METSLSTTLPNAPALLLKQHTNQTLDPFLRRCSGPSAGPIYRTPANPCLPPPQSGFPIFLRSPNKAKPTCRSSRPFSKRPNRERWAFEQGHFVISIWIDDVDDENRVKSKARDSNRRRTEVAALRRNDERRSVEIEGGLS